MSLLSWVLPVRAVLNWFIRSFFISQVMMLLGIHWVELGAAAEEVNILLLCQDMACLDQMVSLFGDERDLMNSWVSIIGNTKYKFFHIGGPQIARRVWRDYGAMDAVVYIVNADAIIMGHAVPGAGEDLINLSYDEAFQEAPFLIFGLRFLEGFLDPRERRERLRYFLPRGFLGQSSIQNAVSRWF